MIYVLGALIALGLLRRHRGHAEVAVDLCGRSSRSARWRGLVDFYRWGYQYGHNLDPNAAIQVPGMTYQPPIIGYKNLLNFTAYSGPDIGGWIMIVSGCIAGMLLGWEQFLRKAKAGKQFRASAPRAAVGPVLGVADRVLPHAVAMPAPSRCATARMNAPTAR